MKLVINQKINKILKHPFTYILIIFIITRIILTIVGTTTRINSNYSSQFNFSQHSAVDMWGGWDSWWYNRIATTGYSGEKITAAYRNGQSELAFFPLYPLLTQALGKIVGNVFTAGLIISNLALLGSAWLLYLYVKIDSDEPTAKRAVRYLFIFPIAFVFSCFLTESLFLFLVLLSFYFARKRYWLWCGLAGFFASLTRNLGVFLILPLFFEYLDSINYQIRKINHNIIYFLFLPLALFLVSYFNYKSTGDWLNFIHIQSAWGRQPGNPLLHILNDFMGGEIRQVCNCFFLFLVLGIISLNLRYLKFQEWLFAMYSIFIPASTGIVSIPRYSLIIFPIYIILAKISHNKTLDFALMLFFIPLQIMFISLWSIGSDIIM